MRRNLWEIHGEDIRQDQPECTQETPKIKNMTWHRNKQRKFVQQPQKWNKGHYKKRDIWIKEDNTNYKKKKVEQRFGKTS
jgi:hypothetical protein